MLIVAQKPNFVSSASDSAFIASSNLLERIFSISLFSVISNTQAPARVAPDSSIDIVSMATEPDAQLSTTAILA